MRLFLRSKYIFTWFTRRWICTCFYLFCGTYTFFLINKIRSVSQSCPTLCDPMNRSTPGLPVHHQLPKFTETHVHWVRMPSSHLIKIWNASWICMSSLHRGHANLLCIFPVLVYVLPKWAQTKHTLNFCIHLPNDERIKGFSVSLEQMK